MIYTGAVYGAFKEDRGADIKTGLFMEEQPTHGLLCGFTQSSVCLWVKEEEGGWVGGGLRV